jgi:hypothetical protein
VAESLASGDSWLQEDLEVPWVYEWDPEGFGHGVYGSGSGSGSG